MRAMPAGAWATVQSPVASLVRTEWRGEESAAVAHDQCLATPLVNFTLRVILALVVIGAFGGIAVWAVVAVLRTTWLTKTQRLIEIGGIIFVMALLIAWVFFWPVYWD